MAKAKTPHNGSAKPVKFAIAAAELPEIKPARKAKTARPEATKSVAPPNLDEQIRRRAYELWEQCGYQPGHESEHWLSAEREIMSRHSRQPQHTT